MNSKAPILVTGSHKSGSTWTGKMISLSNDVRYIDEVFTPSKNHHKSPIKIWNVDANLLTDEKQQEYKEYLSDFLWSLPYNLYEEIVGLYKNSTKIRYIKRVWERVYELRKINKRPLLKDPIALLSAEWLQKNFNSKNIILIRHPAAFVESALAKGWQFDVTGLYKQPDLLKGFYREFKEDIEGLISRNADLLDQNIFAWNFLHHRINYYKAHHNDWYFVRHEDLARNPIQEFKNIYDYLGLNYTKKIKDKIKNSTRSDSSRNYLKRDSRKLVKKWKARLSPKQIDKIKEETKNIWQYFYSESDW